MGTPDPCSAIPIPSVKQACENMGKTLTGGSSGGALGSLLGVNAGFDFRHFMVRVAEFGIGAVLVIVAVDALVKAEVMPSPVVKSAKSLGKKAFK